MTPGIYCRQLVPVCHWTIVSLRSFVETKQCRACDGHKQTNVRSNGRFTAPAGKLYLFFFFTARCTLVQSAVLRSHIVCPSVRGYVRLSVTLVNCDHIGWNSSKIISPLVSLGRSLFATPTWRVCSKKNTPKFFARIGVECWKSGLRRTKALISLKRDKMGPRLLLKSNRKSYTRFRLVQKSMTLDDLEGSLCTLFQNTCVFRSSLWKFEWR